MSIPDGAEYWWDIKGYSSCYDGGPQRQGLPGPPGHAKGSIHIHADERFSKKRMLSLCGQPFRPTRLRQTPTSEKLNDGALCLACVKLYDFRDNTKPVCVVQTAQLKFSGGIDVSRKTGDTVFAPSWSILQPAIELRRNGHETDETWQRYVDAYTSEMRTSWQRNRAHWVELISSRSIVLKCYCMRQHLPRCHRVVLASLLERVGSFVGTDVFYVGEVGESLLLPGRW